VEVFTLATPPSKLKAGDQIDVSYASAKGGRYEVWVEGDWAHWVIIKTALAVGTALLLLGLSIRILAGAGADECKTLPAPIAPEGRG
jgi:hypothetical protein